MPAARSRSRRSGKVIAVSGGGWGVGDLLGATRAALAVPDATVLCLCGRNDKLRARVARELGGEPRLRLMGFTDRMGDVLAASDALIHSSAGLTVLEAIIRGCPVISYGFGYGHVRASNAALERFGLAQVARTEAAIGPALENALAERPEPEPSFARRPSTASLILADERRARQLPAVAGADRAGDDRHRRADRGRRLDADRRRLVLPRLELRPHPPGDDRRHLAARGRRDRRCSGGPGAGAGAGALSTSGIHASFTLAKPSGATEHSVFSYGDQAMPLLPGGGLVRWLGTRGQLHHLLAAMGFGHHFLYASNGPSVGQWWLAHGAGGRLVAGAVRSTTATTASGRCTPARWSSCACRAPRTSR